VADLGPKGQAFFEAMAPLITKNLTVTQALILEAARAIDRLEDVDDILAGKDVLDLLRFRLSDREGKVAEVKFDNVLSEARQQQAGLATLMKAILPNVDDAGSQEKVGDPVDQIAARRAARGAGPAKDQGRPKSGTR